MSEIESVDCGTHTYGNVVCLCYPCNAKDRVNREPIQFVMEVA